MNPEQKKKLQDFYEENKELIHSMALSKDCVVKAIGTVILNALNIEKPHKVKNIYLNAPSKKIKANYKNNQEMLQELVLCGDHPVIGAMSLVILEEGSRRGDNEQ